MGSLSEFIQSPIFSRLPYASVAIIILGGIFWWRAGSIQSILERIWYLMAGKTDAHDPALKLFLQKNRDLEKFRFLYRLKIETFADMQNLIAWADAHNIGMLHLQKIRSWIDATTKEIVREPSKYHCKSRVTFAVVASIVFFSAANLGSSPTAYFKMKASGTWFATDATTVRALWKDWWFGEDWSFNVSDCADEQKITRETRFNESETNSICKSMKDGGELRSLTKETIKLQRWFGGVAALVSLVIAIRNFLSALAAKDAENLRKKLYGQKAEIPGHGAEVIKPKPRRPRRKKISDVPTEDSTQQATGQKEEEPKVLVGSRA
ncbi:DUF6216 family protein [Paraburkholderia sp. RL17-381-BIF-C]|uniref:DUF6216 family protein n=1 Tax=Paraburkholderia sp. RL17-381-BIF-C TaxID=3031635 RepID=UPI0038BAA4EB